MDKYTKNLILKFLGLNNKFKWIEFNEREMDILKSRLLTDITLSDLGLKYQISRARVEQILETCVYRIITNLTALMYLSAENEEKVNHYNEIRAELDTYKERFRLLSPEKRKLLEEKDFLLLPVNAFDFENRALKGFSQAGIKTLLDVTTWTESELLSLKHQIGKRSVYLIKQELAGLGLSLKAEDIAEPTADQKGGGKHEKA